MTCVTKASIAYIATQVLYCQPFICKLYWQQWKRSDLHWAQRAPFPEPILSQTLRRFILVSLTCLKIHGRNRSVKNSLHGGTSMWGLISLEPWLTPLLPVPLGKYSLILHLNQSSYQWKAARLIAFAKSETRRRLSRLVVMVLILLTMAPMHSYYNYI